MLKSKKRKLMLLGISLLVFSFLIAGCLGESSNQAPVIEDLDESTSGLEATITGSVSDSDGSVSEVEIAWGDESSDTVDSDFDSIEESHTYDSEGKYDVKVKATDDEGETTSQTISVTVEEETNQAQEMEDLDESTSGLEATITGSVSDSDGSLSEVEIAWGDESSDTVDSEFDSIEESHEYDSGGTYNVKVKATDDEGETTSQTISVSVTSVEMETVKAGTAADESTSIDYDIEMGKYEVTHAEFIEFLNDAGVASDGSYEGKELIDMEASSCAIEHDGSSFYFVSRDYAESGENTPVIYVTWYGALAYCNWLSEQEDLTPAYNLDDWELKDEPQNLEGFRLPTETEWGYAARGGDEGDNTTYAGGDNIDDVAWYDDNSDGKTHPVGEKQDNELGIYDMSGNITEWTNTPDGSDRIWRGGSFISSPSNCAVNYSHDSYPSNGTYFVGFRLTRTK